jgi:pyruvate dehydrogenase E2 component (dihydrolipoamide acetyltransferase)
MATEITMPKLSDTMTEGRLIAWKKSVGEKVERGEIIAEVETDKATMELEAFASGVLLDIRIKPGEMALVGTVIGTIGEAGETAEIQPSLGKPPEKAPIPPPAPPIAQSAAAAPPSQPAGTSDLPFRSSEPPLLPTAAGKAPSSEPETGEKASPRVRRLAREKGIDLGQVKGSGPDGRILQEDLVKAGTGERTQLGLKGPGKNKKPLLVQKKR